MGVLRLLRAQFLGFVPLLLSWKPTVPFCVPCWVGEVRRFTGSIGKGSRAFRSAF